MGDHSVVRELARLLALVLVGCGGTPRVPQTQVAAELGYRSIFPIRKMEGRELHP